MKSSQAASKPGIRADIQGLRAIAVILVVFSHLPQVGKFAGGFVGVDLFFVISGFVISRLLVRNAGNGSGFASGYGIFLARRVIRLVPALFVMLCAGLILGYFLAPPTEFNSIWGGAFWSEMFLSNFYYLSNFDSYWNPEILRNPFLHTWSLGIEFQTYLVMPFLMLWLFSKRWSPRVSLVRSSWVVVAATVLSLLAFVWLVGFRVGDVRGFGPISLAFYTPITRFWEFGLGALGALLSARFIAMTRMVSYLAPAAWLLMIVGTLLSHFAGQLSLAVIPLSVGGMILLWGGESDRGYFGKKVLSIRPAVWLGDRSYSFYLWHWPLLMVAIWLTPGWWPGPFVVLALALLLAAFSYRLLEQRFRFRPDLGTLRRWRGTAVIAAGTTVLILFLGTFPPKVFSAKPAISSQVALSSPVTGSDVMNAVEGCDYQRLEIHCDFFGPNVSEVVVIGDSLGYRSFPAVALAAKKHGFNASELWTGGCSIEFNSCPPFIYEYLGKARVAGIVVATNFDRESSLVNGSERAAGLAPLCPAGQRTIDCELHRQKIAQFKQKADTGLQQLLGYSPFVLVALPFPQQQQLLANCLNPALALRPAEVDPNCLSTSRQWQAERQGLYPAAILDVTRGKPGITVWNPQDYLCTLTDCPGMTPSGEKIMDDAIHWTPAASSYLFPAFEGFVSQLSQ